MLKLEISEEHVTKEEEAQSVLHMQQTLAAEKTSVDDKDIVPYDTAQDQYQAQDPGCQKSKIKNFKILIPLKLQGKFFTNKISTKILNFFIS